MRMSPAAKCQTLGRKRRNTQRRLDGDGEGGTEGWNQRVKENAMEPFGGHHWVLVHRFISAWLADGTAWYWWKILDKGCSLAGDFCCCDRRDKSNVSKKGNISC